MRLFFLASDLNLNANVKKKLKKDWKCTTCMNLTCFVRCCIPFVPFLKLPVVAGPHCGEGIAPESLEAQ